MVSGIPENLRNHFATYLRQKIRDLGLPGNWALYFFSKLWYKFEDRNLPLHQKCEKRRGVGGEERRGREATQEGFTAAAPLVRPQMEYS